MNNQKIDFPVNFDIKIIVTADLSVDENRVNIENIFIKLGLRYKDIRHKASESNKYYSFTANLDVNDEKTFTKLYNKLKELPNIKVAL